MTNLKKSQFSGLPEPEERMLVLLNKYQSGQFAPRSQLALFSKAPPGMVEFHIGNLIDLGYAQTLIRMMSAFGEPSEGAYYITPDGRKVVAHGRLFEKYWD